MFIQSLLDFKTVINIFEKVYSNRQLKIQYQLLIFFLQEL